MNKFRFTIKLFVIATFLLAFASIAQAQATRTWVSGVGDDVNPCSRTAPCKTYAGAISKTASNGEISTLDPGGFGAVTITKSIMIEGTTGQGYGSILASGTSGVIINAAGINVILRNLSINGASTTAGSGVRFLQGRSLIVENCHIQGFTGAGGSSLTGNGISVALAATGSNVVVRNTTIQNCTTGIRMTTTVGAVTGNIDNVRIDQPSATVPAAPAIDLAAGAIATVRGSFITLHPTGINVTGVGSAAIVLGTTIWNTTTGVNAGSSTVKMSDSQLVNNVTGVSGGTLLTGCDNYFAGNTNNTSGTVVTNTCVQ